MQARFYLDPETNLPHIYNHHVTEDEVEDILSRPGEDLPGREGSRVAIGQTHLPGLINNVKHKKADICVLYMYRTMSRIVCL
jgi:hypothetical protein